MSEKALKILLNISDSVNAAARLNFKVRILLVLFTQVINKHLRMNDSINLESLTEMLQHFGKAKCQHKKNFLEELPKPSRWKMQRSKNHE